MHCPADVHNKRQTPQLIISQLYRTERQSRVVAIATGAAR
jgi:hypothetical protein